MSETSRSRIHPTMDEFFGIGSDTIYCKIPLTSEFQNRIHTIISAIINTKYRQIIPCISLFEICFNKTHPRYVTLDIPAIAGMIKQCFSRLTEQWELYMCDENPCVISGNVISVCYDLSRYSQQLQTIHQQIMDVLSFTYQRESLDESSGLKYLIYQCDGEDFFVIPQYLTLFDQRTVDISLMSTTRFMHEHHDQDLTLLTPHLEKICVISKDDCKKVTVKRVQCLS